MMNDERLSTFKKEHDSGSFSGRIIHELVDEVRKLRTDLETERMRLAGCGVAALCNTPESIALHRVEDTSSYYCSSYQNVCDMVDREMALRTSLSSAERERDNYRNEVKVLRQMIDGTDKGPAQIVLDFIKDNDDLRRLGTKLCTEATVWADVGGAMDCATNRACLRHAIEEFLKIGYDGISTLTEVPHD